jgi:lipooligosaccharide transport system permease protein
MATATLRVIEGNALHYRRVWRGTVITTFLNPILFLTAMGVILGNIVDRGSGAATLEGFSYLEFLATGLLAAQAMQTGSTDGSWPVMAGIKWLKTYDAMLTTPVGVGALVRGHVMWLTMKLLVTSTVFVLVAVAFGAMTLWPGILAIFPAALTGAAFGSAITAWTATRESETGITTVFRFGILPLYLFSGTFFPISQLPGYLQPAAWATPLWHGVEMTRAAGFGATTVFPVWMSVIYLTVWIVVGIWLSQRFLGKRLLP